MKRFAIAAIVVLASAGAAGADSVLVLKADGRVDAKVRAKIEGAVLALAKSTGQQTTPGDITYRDAAAMVGCKPDADTCREQVREMLAVDEIVTISTAQKAGGIEVAVRRVGKSGTKSATAIVTADKVDQLDSIGPLFGKAGPPSALPPPTPAVTTTPDAREPIREPAGPARKPEPAPATVPPPSEVADPTPPPVVTAQTGPAGPRDDDARPRNRLAMVGMVGGGVLLVSGLVFWASAKNIESELADAPMRTRDDLRKLQDLEAEGDAYATTGNLLVLSGLVLGGVSTYFYVKSGKRTSRTARITPTVLGRGAGLAITWGSP